jgi:hypothetical protein
MILIKKNRITHKNCVNVRLSTTNATRIDLGPNPCVRDERLATNRLVHDTPRNTPIKRIS